MSKSWNYTVAANVTGMYSCRVQRRHYVRIVGLADTTRAASRTRFVCVKIVCRLSLLLLTYIVLYMQRVFYFPIKPRLQKLLKIPAYNQWLQHEFDRPRNKALVTDVYDTKAWHQYMGTPTFPCSRVGLLFCVDAIPAFAAGTLSLKPAEFINLSLPPGVRTKSENILLFMLLPNNLDKGAAQKKYYDFAAEYELIEMATIGRLVIILTHN